MSDLIQENPSWKHTLFKDYSYVLKGKDVLFPDEGLPLESFDLFPGNWVILARAIAHSQSSDSDDVCLTLKVTEGNKVMRDRCLTSVSHGRWATLSLMLGVELGGFGKAQLFIDKSGPSETCELSDIVVTAMKMDKLLVGKL